ncbi:MAG: hypothetical protein QOJ07_1841 [Thermoleophilaceae bacterium]|nr:hypothetical protein [Thermoleophilaceae bacterium]
MRRFEQYGELARSLACPHCGSRPRHRFLRLYLDANPVPRGASVLHVAPEPIIETWLRDLAGDAYVSADLEDPRAMVKADLTALPFEDDSFELILCSHVLEHVPDDAAAMREMARVLRPSGRAIVQTPVNYEQDATFEDPTVESPEERLRLFSQVDHVRVYGPDVRDRLEAAGFAVDIEVADDLFDAADCERYGLAVRDAWPLRNDLYVCTRR